MSEVIIKFTKLVPEAHEPTRSYETAAGWDLYCLKDSTLHYDPRILEVGIAVEIPKGYFGWITGRSSTSKSGLLVLPGIIDSDYRGEIGPRVVKLDGRLFEVKAGDRIAQLLILPHIDTQMVESSLTSTMRGTQGHGSSGR